MRGGKKAGIMQMCVRYGGRRAAAERMESI